MPSPRDLARLSSKLATRREALVRKGVAGAIAWVCDVAGRRNETRADKQVFRAMCWMHAEALCNLLNALDRGRDGREEFDRLKEQIAKHRAGEVV